MKVEGGEVVPSNFFAYLRPCKMVSVQTTLCEGSYLYSRGLSHVDVHTYVRMAKVWLNNMNHHYVRLLVSTDNSVQMLLYFKTLTSSVA